MSGKERVLKRAERVMREVADRKVKLCRIREACSIKLFK